MKLAADETSEQSVSKKKKAAKLETPTLQQGKDF